MLFFALLSLLYHSFLRLGSNIKQTILQLEALSKTARHRNSSFSPSLKDEGVRGIVSCGGCDRGKSPILLDGLEQGVVVVGRAVGGVAGYSGAD